MTGNSTYGTHANWKLHPTKNWKDLIACFQVGAKYPQFAHQVLEAVSDGLNERKLIEDAGYQKCVELLVEMAIGAQRKDFIGHMREMGIGLSDNPPPQELIAKVADAIEEAGMVEDIVLERLSGILRTPELALTLSGMTGLDEAAVMRTLDGSFWKKATPDEKARMLELLVASVTLYEDKMDIEVRTEGLTCAMEEIENESDQD